MTRPLGMNLASLNYWTLGPFLDVCKSAGPWGGNGAIGPDGHPTGLTTVEVQRRIWLEEGAEYTLIVTKGEIAKFRLLVPNFKAPAPTSPGRYVFIGRNVAGGTTLGVEPKGPGPIQIAVVRSDNLAAWQAGETFTRDFLRFVAPARYLRFMDWQRCNAAAPPPASVAMDAVTWTNGVPIAVMADLCNRVGAGMWLPVHSEMPLADQVSQASTAAGLLDPGLPLHVEYSNEMWNTAPAYPQGRKALSLPGGPDVGYGRLAGTFGKALSQETNRARLIICGQFGQPMRVLTSLAAAYVAGVPRWMISHIAGAPYLSGKGADEASLTASLVASAPALNALHKTWGANARAAGVGYANYEYGCGIVADQSALNAAVAHSEPVAAAVGSVVDGFFAAGGDMASIFDSVSPSFGVAQSYSGPDYPLRRRWVERNALAYKAASIAPEPDTIASTAARARLLEGNAL